MAMQSSVLLQFQRPDGRLEFDRTRRDLKTALRDAAPEAAAGRLLDFAASLDTGVARLKRDLVGSALCWNEENQQLTKWIHQQYRSIVEMGMRVGEAMRREGRDDALAREVSALTLLHWGESLKWMMWREREDYAPLHEMLAAAAVSGSHREKLTVTADGRRQETSIEGLYFRALLLDRFTSGSLTRQQVEILDAWLWEWMGALQGSREHPGGVALRVDLDANAGLREGRREGEGACLYLALAPLETQRRRIIKELHCGRIVPAHGCVAEFRIEEHICVLDHLRRAFCDPEGETAKRAARQSASRTRIEVWVGLQEIFARGVGITVGTETGRYRALNLSDPAIEHHKKSRYSDATRRYLWLVDASATGMGLEALESDAEGIEAGDLLGWRNTVNGPIVLAQVMRRIPSSTSGQVFLGVRLLTEEAQPLKLSQVVTFDNGNADGTYLFVPGDDPSGCRDAFLVSESTYELHASYNAHIGSSSFTIQFNRVRGQGRGWMLAGFEIIPAKRLEPMPAATRELRLDGLDFRLELETESQIEDPWGAEVSPRLVA